MNPGSPTPQAGILNQAIRRPQTPARYQEQILKTIEHAKTEGKVENTLKAFSHSPKQLTKSRRQNSEGIKTAIANAKKINGEEEYVVKTAKTVDEATKLPENDFQYIQEIDGLKLYRKRR